MLNEEYSPFNYAPQIENLKLRTCFTWRVFLFKEANAPFLVMDIIIKGLSFPSENRTFHDESLE